MTEPDFDYGQYAADAPDERDLDILSTLVENLLEAERAVAEAEQELVRRQGLLRSIQEHDIPELMEKVRMEEFVTASGFHVKLDRTVRCSPPKANRDACWDWLEEHGHGGLIKRSISVGFSRQEKVEAEELLGELAERFENVKQDQKVESATLTAFANERVRAERETDVPPADRFPMELFGAYEQRSAKVRLKKK